MAYQTEYLTSYKTGNDLHTGEKAYAPTVLYHARTCWAAYKTGLNIFPFLGGNFYLPWHAWHCTPWSFQASSQGSGTGMGRGIHGMGMAGTLHEKEGTWHMEGMGSLGTLFQMTDTDGRRHGMQAAALGREEGRKGSSAWQALAASGKSSNLPPASPMLPCCAPFCCCWHACHRLYLTYAHHALFAFLLCCHSGIPSGGHEHFVKVSGEWDGDGEHRAGRAAGTGRQGINEGILGHQKWWLADGIPGVRQGRGGLVCWGRTGSVTEKE